MADQQHRWKAFRRAAWGPARYVLDKPRIEVRVREQLVALDLGDPRPALDRQADRDFVAPLSVGVAVEWNGRRVATLRSPAGSSMGIVRRSRIEIVGDDDFVTPGMEFTSRALPSLLTLRDEQGTLVASRRWAEPINMAVINFSIVYDREVFAPRVSRRTRDEHIALWLALKASYVG